MYVIESIRHTYVFYDYSVCDCQNVTHVVELFNSYLCEDSFRIATYQLEYFMHNYSDSVISYSFQEGRMVLHSNMSSCEQYPLDTEFSFSFPIVFSLTRSEIPCVLFDEVVPLFSSIIVPIT